MTIRFLQTCDPSAYTSLLAATSRSVLEYCGQWGCEYDVFVGLKRGAKPWHAALNRIIMLSDYVTAGFRGWAIYLDADAYVADMQFDVAAYLEQHTGKAMILAPAGAAPHVWWNVNNGVFAINLAHEGGREIVRRWRAKLDAVPEEALRNEITWGAEIDDQSSLTEVFREMPDCESILHVANEVLNWNNRFAPQLIRGEGSLEFRARRLAHLVSEAMGEADGGGKGVDLDLPYRDIVYGIYNAILLRDADAHGFENAVENLKSGRRNCLQELKSCFNSTEFEQKAPEFLRRYLTREGVAFVARTLAEEPVA